jgi:putative restriction endonuclease
VLWLEISLYELHGGGSWAFPNSLWSPSHKNEPHKATPGTWPYWETMRRVQAGDTVLHLRGKDKNKASFVGFSTAETDFFETSERPPDPGEWGFARTFYRVLLKDYVPFTKPVLLQDIFAQRGDSLREYYEHNRARPSEERYLLFFVIQGGRLQRQNGAYLSPVDDELSEILLGSDRPSVGPTRQSIIDVSTGERIVEMRARLGQQRFSRAVRENYGNKCCFPGCNISDRIFLVGSHIARWADVPALRGNPSNGLCLCLIHDRAFELGVFTVSSDYRVVINRRYQTLITGSWYENGMLPAEGQRIHTGKIAPSKDALQYHWARIDLARELK